MPRRLQQSAPLGFVLLVALALFLPGIDWGLPSHAADRFLFDDRAVWPGAKIYALAGGWDADAAIGADVARHPLGRSDDEGPILVNGDDVARARIIQRYRLYSDQPDEMITFRALSGIDPAHGKLDPKLYQYGGLWIYGVGALLEVAKMLGAIAVRHDVAYYLDHPEAFGRFYVIARLYAASWGLVLVAAAYGLMRQMGSRRLWAAIAGATVAMMPVVVNAAHEAKPHLPGAALVLLAVWAGGEYVRSGGWRRLLLTGGLCGAAAGMVLWAAPVFVVLGVVSDLIGAWNPAAARRRGALMWIGAALAVGFGVYAITNPYVVIHLVSSPAVLRSNLHNTSAMYDMPAGSGAIANAVVLIAAGMSPALAIFGAGGAVALAMRAWKNRRARGAAPPAGILLATVAVLIGIFFIGLAAGKPGEYGRFALVPDVTLAMAAVMAIETFLRRAALAAAVALLGITAIFGIRYDVGFVRDAGPNSSRLAAAEQLREAPGNRLAIAAEPAPYCLPPVDLFRWKLLLVPNWSEATPAADASCRAVDYPAPSGWIFATPLSWADKRFEISDR